MRKFMKARRLLAEANLLDNHAHDRWFLVNDTKPLTRMKELAKRKREEAIALLE